MLSPCATHALPGVRILLSPCATHALPGEDLVVAVCDSRAAGREDLEQQFAVVSGTLVGDGVLQSFAVHLPVACLHVHQVRLQHTQGLHFIVSLAPL